MQANQFEIVMTQEHQDAWDEIAAEQLALAKAEMAQRTPEENARRHQQFMKQLEQGEIVSAEIVDEDLTEEQITEIRWKWIYRTSNQNGLAKEYGISMEKLWEVIGNAWSWCNNFTPEMHHRLYLKIVGPLGQSCPCCGPNLYKPK